MANYNLDRIRNALAKTPVNAPTANGGKTQFAKAKYFKPGIGKYDLRFMPFLSEDGQPTQEVLYYEKLTEDNKRIVAPQGFGLPDPIRDVFDEKRKEKGGWAVAKFLKPKKRYYAIVIDRKDEAAGPQIWEFSEEIRDALYTTLVSKDYEDEYVFDPDKGYDWELTATQALDGSGKPRTFNGNIVKKFTLNIRKRPSPLHKDRETASKWIAEMPKLDEMFKRQCKSSDELIEILENFVARLETQGEPKSEGGTDHNAARTAGTTTAPVAPPKAASKMVVEESDEDEDSKLDAAFGDMT